MHTSVDILRLRVLLCFLTEDSAACTVTEISKTLGEPKYKITRTLSNLAQENLIDKSNPRNPKLTDAGLREAKKYEERIDVALNHLIYEGLDTETAYHDALYWSLYSTDKSMQVIQESQEQQRVKHILKGKKAFSGSLFCKHIKDGTYHFPFVIYREKIKDKSNISDTNDCFEHPCTLIAKNNNATIQFRAINNTLAHNKKSNRTIQNLLYLDGDTFVRAEKSAKIFSISAAALHFINISTGVGQILHGSMCLKIQYTEHNGNLSEETVIFTILI